MVCDADHITEKSLFGNMNAKKFGHLIKHDHKSNPCFESGQNRRRNEVGDKPQTEHSGYQQHHADQHCECRGGGHQHRRIAIRHHQTELCARQNRQRGSGTHT